MYKYVFLILVIVLSLLFLCRWYFGTATLYDREVKKQLALTSGESELIDQADLLDLPVQLQTYLTKAGVIGTPRVEYFHVTMSGDMRLDINSNFSPVEADQYTFITTGTRLFYMKMNFKGAGISGLHHYNSHDAFMKIKILDLLKVVDESGETMQQAETVTYFNDLCIMAPGALLEEEIIWESLDTGQVLGSLKKHGHEVKAILTFNTEGMLENFESQDRLQVQKDGSVLNIPWSTPMSEFGPVGVYFLPRKGQAIWHDPDQSFDYIHLDIEDVSVNEAD